MVDYHAPSSQLPHRKPLPQTQIFPDGQPSSHSRTRTTSSNVLPLGPPSPKPQQPQPTQMYQQPAPSQYNATTRRTLSNATTSTASTNRSGGSGQVPQRTNSGLRRSTSRSSGSSPTSYVALMRKQKATVWCDRAQFEDPRLMAAQRAAKMRAAMEVVGGQQAARVSTSSSNVSGGMRSKIRHPYHGAPKASLYAPGNLAGSGVPMRLSASEVDEGGNEEKNEPYHHRTGSGRSSLGSGGKRIVSYNGAQQGRFSTNSTPPSGNGSSPSDTVAELSEETPVPGHYSSVQPQHKTDYFAQAGGTGVSGGSGSSGERENSFGNLGTMPLGTMPERSKEAAEQRKTTDDLHRRGSVDERTMTMSGAVRLFVANPDLDD